MELRTQQLESEYVTLGDSDKDPKISCYDLQEEQRMIHWTLSYIFVQWTGDNIHAQKDET